MAPNLATVARYAGVSEATVSRVLNGKPGVGESTRAAVQTALDVLGYQRPGQLQAERFRLVGILLPELRNPIFPAFGEVIAATLAQRGLASVLCATGQAGMTEADCVELLLERRVSGLVFVSGEHSRLIAESARYLRLVDRGLPLVAVNGVSDGLAIPCVSTDEAAGVELAVRHLVSLGHDRIGLVTGERDNVNSARQHTAFRTSLHEHLAMDDEQVLLERSLYSIEGGSTATSRLLRRGATAVICGSDMMAIGALRAARRAGLRVPQDFSVIGHDDSIFIPAVDPPLTTVRQPVDDMSRAIVSLLWLQMSGTMPAAEEIHFAPDLVVRSSTAAAPPGPRPPIPSARDDARMPGAS